jgi:putative DNA primase/helicase
LTRAGWTKLFTHGDETFWRRPGKSIGHSATTNYKGSGLLYVFSSSCEFEPFQSYSKFGAYARLECGGDFKAAAKALAAGGYGEPPRGRKAKAGATRPDPPRGNGLYSVVDGCLCRGTGTRDGGSVSVPICNFDAHRRGDREG